MNIREFSILDLLKPEILIKTPDYLLLYKPPRIHSAPGKGKSLTEWLAEEIPETGKFESNERGLVHRLDYETQGLVLFAANQKIFEILKKEQARGSLVKEYGALVSKTRDRPEGFPLFNDELLSKEFPKHIQSSFRPYGPGRKEVRPVFKAPLPEISDPRLYDTEILGQNLSSREGIWGLSLRIKKGFRHQLRCHLAWAGFPIINDPLYGGEKTGKGFLALRAEAIEFEDPSNNEIWRYVLPPLDPDDI